MFFFFYTKYLGIISAEYDNEKSYSEQQKEEITKFNAALQISNSSASSLDENEIIILWNNLPKVNYPIGNNDTLFQTLCNELNNSNIENVIIYSPLSLMENNNIQKYLERIVLLYNKLNKKLIFIEDNPYPTDNDNLTITVHEHNSPIATFSDSLDNYVYKFLIQHLQSLIDIIPKETSNDIDFIHCYFEWQKGIFSLQQCSEYLGNISKATFYRYVEEFEKSPEYPEYLKVYYDSIYEISKKGKVPDPIAFIEKFNEYIKSGLSPSSAERSLCLDYKLLSIIDCHRIKLACDKKINIMKHKGIYKAKFEEYLSANS